MWVALLDGTPVLGFTRKPKRVEDSEHVGFRDTVNKIGCHVAKDGSWKEFRVERLIKGGFK